MKSDTSKRAFIVWLFLLGTLFVNVCAAQGTYISLGHRTYHSLDRFQIASGAWLSDVHTSLKPYNRQYVASSLDSLKLGDISLSRSDLFNVDLQRMEDFEWIHDHPTSDTKPVLKYFYRNPSALYHAQADDYFVHINPVLHFQYGSEADTADQQFINTRGVELRGRISKKVGFYSLITENQARYSTYIQQKIKSDSAVPGHGFYKEFKTTGVDFLNTRGYVTFSATKNIGFTFGHDKHFIGNGYRSLFLSDQSANYIFLRINTRFWKIHYQNLFTELTSQYGRGADTLLSRKYAVFHYLSLNVSKHVNVGIFENIVFERQNQFSIQYLNPVIFYRSVEQAIGSFDNAMLGVDVKVNFAKHFSLYGQILLDELNFYQLIDSVGWWGNKFGFQTGFKYIDVAGVSNLDIQGEFNLVRPYTYTHHGKPIANYTHYNQPLAHPLGANFSEIVGILYYQPLPKVNLAIKYIHAVYGTDDDTSNWGGDIFLDYDTREQEYYNTLGQGIRNTMDLIDVVVSYQWRPNIFVELLYNQRLQDSDLDSQDSSINFVGVGFRMNIIRQLFDY